MSTVDYTRKVVHMMNFVQQQYTCLPILHLLSVHPGVQTQVPALSQTPFSQGGTQTAEKPTNGNMNFCKLLQYTIALQLVPVTWSTDTIQHSIK